jgi:hypothetical protein
LRASRTRADEAPFLGVDLGHRSGRSRDDIDLVLGLERAVGFEVLGYRLPFDRLDLDRHCDGGRACALRAGLLPRIFVAFAFFGLLGVATAGGEYEE